jgi:HAD superfamily hydrolase (TIGR01509 family)
MKSEARPIKAVLFDLDSTLTKPGALDFKKVKSHLKCPANTPILEFIECIPDPIVRETARCELDRFEAEAAASSEPNSGAEDIVSYLRKEGLFVGIITRNSRVSVERSLENFKNTDLSDFDLVITRDDLIEPKPSHEGILTAAKRLNLEPRQMLVVGDFIFDIQAGNRAGAVTVFLDNGNANHAVAGQSDHTISHLHELKEMVRQETAQSWI